VKKRKRIRKTLRLAAVLAGLLLLLALAARIALPLLLSREEAVPKETVPPSTLSFAEIPPYSGSDYVLIHGGKPDFELGQLTAEPYVVFSALDELGRSGAAMACLGPETLPDKDEQRDGIGDMRPSGWHTQRYDELIEDHYLYNRCHLIGFLLCGNRTVPENFFTGTRHLNAESMLPFEIRTANYIEKTGNHVIYRVTPVYESKNLLASGVQIEARSVEDLGRGLSLNVYVYNVQPGVVIDYATGDSRAAESGG
jgi:DNA-entry nuclease